MAQSLGGGGLEGQRSVNSHSLRGLVYGGWAGGSKVYGFGQVCIFWGES